VLALFCGNVFIVGINQIYDVDIDKVQAHMFREGMASHMHIHIHTKSSSSG
jgi:4-hydroxybenzoate polyprenyltransferase